MKIERIYCRVVEDLRRVKNDNTIPLKLRITFKGNRRLYGTPYSVSKSEWDLMHTTAIKGKLKTLKNEITKIELDAEEIASKISPFSFIKFEDAFFKKMEEPIKSYLIEDLFRLKTTELLESNQVGTATSYQTAFKSLQKFKKNLLLQDVTAKFLNEYEKFMLVNNKSKTTVGIYLRSLRAVINIAYQNGEMEKKDYPFGRGKYQIPTGKNIKKALSKQEVLKLYTYNCIKYSTLDKAKDFWMFSYLNNGINFTDIAHIKWEQINENSFWFYREKTKKTRKSNPLPIQILLNEESKSIIEKWGNKNSKFVFDIILEKDSSIKIKQKIQQFIKVTNKWLDRIGVDLEFAQPLRTYSARHSFTSILIKEGNAPIEYVSQSLGHSSILTTQKYFSGFELSEQSKYSSALL